MEIFALSICTSYTREEGREIRGLERGMLG